MSVQLYTVVTKMFCLLIILTTNLSSASVVRSPCLHQPNSREHSRWATRLQAERQILNLNAVDLDFLQDEIQGKLTDLAGLIHEKKNEFTRDELGRSYNYYDLALKTMNYDYLVSHLTHTSTSADDLSGAYNLFQRLALAVEVVRLDMDHHEDMTVRTRDLWHRLEVKIDNLLKLFYVGLDGEGELIGRQVLPSHFRCVEESVTRDYRDFFVLRHILQVTNLYKS